jgi:Fe-S-cluster formation regulator IscX/YfhJ
VDPGLIKLFYDSISDIEDENGWAFLGDLGNLILKKRPEFDPRNYGFTKLLPLIKNLKKFEIDERETNRKNVKHIYVRKR